jgi:hypothetical protein
MKGELMRNILVIIGSGIMNGNTDRLAEVFIKGAMKLDIRLTGYF